MIGSTLSLVIELIMVMLLVVTISYCFIVNRKLTALRTDQSGLRHVIAELNRSSERAQQVISEMRRTAIGVEGQMAGHVEAARHASSDLLQNLERSKELRDIAKKLTDVDLNALRAIEKAAHPAAVSAEQIKLSKELKRKRIGFGQERFSGGAGGLVSQGQIGQGQIGQGQMGHGQAKQGQAKHGQAEMLNNSGQQQMGIAQGQQMRAPARPGYETVKKESA